MGGLIAQKRYASRQPVDGERSVTVRLKELPVRYLDTRLPRYRYRYLKKKLFTF